MTLRTRVYFIVYRDEQESGWPENYRRIVRYGMCPPVDFEAQASAPQEVVLEIEPGLIVDPLRDALALDPDPTIVPTIVPQPE